MAYGRQSIMNGLRMAGDKLREVDHAYASRVSDLIEGDPSKTNPIRGLLAILGGAEPGQMKAVAEPGEKLSKLQQAIGSTWAYGAPAAGIGIRYGLPVAGLYALERGISAGYDALSGVPIIDGQPNQGELPM